MRQSPLAAFALIALSAAWSGAGVAGEPPTAAGVEEAHSHFNAGVRLLEDPDGARYEEAHAEFKRAFELSGSPTVLGNLGLCAMKLERDGEAIESFARYLEEVSDIDPEERSQIEHDLETLKTGVATVAIVVDPAPAGGWEISDTRMPVQGASVRNGYSFNSPTVEVLLRPGHHVISVHIAGRESDSWDFQVAPGARAEHRFVLREPKPAPEVTPEPAPKVIPAAPEEPSLVGPLLLTGFGAATLAVGAALGVVTLGKVRDIEDDCPGDVCPAGEQENIDETRDFVKATDFVLLAGGIVTAGGIAWLAAALSSGGGPEDEPEGVTVSGACSPLGCGASLTGRF